MTDERGAIEKLDEALAAYCRALTTIPYPEILASRRGALQTIISAALDAIEEERARRQTTQVMSTEWPARDWTKPPGPEDTFRPHFRDEGP